MSRIVSIEKDDSNLSSICENIINRTYCIGILPQVETKHHARALHKNFTKSGLTRKSRKDLKKQITIGDLTKILNSKYKFLIDPFQKNSNKDLLNVLKIIQQELSGLNHIIAEKRIINGLIASVVNPINRKEYGSNDPKTIKAKGFDKPLVDTGEILNNITAWRDEK